MTESNTYEKGFDGKWLVSEYVYSPSGRFQGVVKQERWVEPLENGRLRISQKCNPAPSLEGHAMARFRGHHVFECEPDGQARRYLGPSVLGTGLTWGEGAMTGRGIWPDFGHNFTSFAVVGQPGVQLTGGAFFDGPEMVANIAGIACPQTDEETTWPEFSGPENPAAIGLQWTGTIRRVNPAGEVLTEQTLNRTYSSKTTQRPFAEEVDGQSTVQLVTEPNRGRLMVSGQIADRKVYGLGKQYGWLVQLELCLPGGVIVEWMEILDGARDRVVGIRRWLTDGILDQVEIVNLAPRST